MRYATQASLKMGEGQKPNPTEETADAIRKAKKSVLAAVYKFNEESILKALKTLKKDVTVRLVVDEEELRKYKHMKRSVKEAAEKGAEVRVWKRGKLHAKFTIVDGKRVLSGSYNWNTSAAGKNVELLLSFQEPTVVKRFERLFASLWAKGKPLKGLSH